MLLGRLGTSDCCLVTAIVIMATMFGQSSAQSYSDTTTIDFTSAAARLSRRVVVAQVSKLRFLLPEFQQSGDEVHTDSDRYHLDPCEAEGFQCRHLDLIEWNVAESFLLIYTLSGEQSKVNITMDSRFRAGCTQYMHPQNAVASDPITLTCEPLPEDGLVFEGNVTITWRRFSQLDNLEYFLQNCSTSSENCSNSFTDDILEAGDDFMMSEYNLTIQSPENNQAWFVPSFTFANFNGSHTYVAPYTFLYRWPRITTRYEFSLEVVEPASNYSELLCEADSFPPVTTFGWTRDGTDIHLSAYDRYVFRDVVASDQVSVNRSITITQVTFNDSALFECKIVELGGRIETNVSLSVRLRVKSHLRPLWPAVGIIGVGIVVALFIIIGHFVDKEIEKHQNEPSNPSHHKRLQSITSTMENETSQDNGPSGKKHPASQEKYSIGSHTAVKRLSSARIQLLEEPQC